MHYCHVNAFFETDHPRHFDVEPAAWNYHETSYALTFYGPAATKCLESADGRLFVDNGEYISQVNYCPFCGLRAAAQMQPRPVEIE